MIGRAQFERIRARHGAHASWAVWTPPSRRPKSNVGDLTVLDPGANPSLLAILRPDVVLAGLNFSRHVSATAPFSNFHDPRPQAQDYKIRFAFHATPYYGAYMTDVIKDVEMLKSADLLRYITPELIRKNVTRFRGELQDLETERPIILAFGGAAHALLRDNLYTNEYSALVKLTHYSRRIGMQEYRKAVLAQIGEGMSGVCW